MQELWEGQVHAGSFLLIAASICSPICEISLVALDKCLLQKQSHNCTKCLAVPVVRQRQRNDAIWVREEHFDTD